MRGVPAWFRTRPCTFRQKAQRYTCQGSVTKKATKRSWEPALAGSREHGHQVKTLPKRKSGSVGSTWTKANWEPGLTPHRPLVFRGLRKAPKQTSRRTQARSVAYSSGKRTAFRCFRGLARQAQKSAPGCCILQESLRLAPAVQWECLLGQEVMRDLLRALGRGKELNQLSPTLHSRPVPVV